MKNKTKSELRVTLSITEKDCIDSSNDESIY